MNPLNDQAQVFTSDVPQAVNMHAAVSQTPRPAHDSSPLGRAAEALAKHGFDQACMAYMVASPVGGPLANSHAGGGAGVMGFSGYCLARVTLKDCPKA